MDRLGLYHAIFSDPTQQLSTQPSVDRWHVAYECLEYIFRSNRPGSIGSLLIRSEDAAYLAWNLAAVTPWIALGDPAGHNQKVNNLPAVAAVAREGFRAPNRVIAVMAASHRHRMEIIGLKVAVCSKDASSRQRARLGMAIRRWDGQGGSWTLQVLSALLVDAMEHLDSWEDCERPGQGQDQETESPRLSSREDDGTLGRKCSAFIEGWQLFLDHLVELDVYEAPAMKRLIDGRSLANALGIRPGKWTGKALDICMAWQLRNPGEVNPQGAVDEVRERKEELGIPISG